MSSNAYDYQLDTLKFLSAASKDYPYRRATGEARTQQIDTNAQPGEQSLSTWWLRSQASWTSGAGYKFMEPSNDEEVQSGFYKSFGIDPFTVPGKLQTIPAASFAFNTSS